MRLVRRGKIIYAWIPKKGGGTRLVSTNCTDRKAALLRSAELERSALASRPAVQLTTREACDRFLASRVALGCAEETCRFYEVKLMNLVEGLPEQLADLADGRAVETYIEARLKSVKRPTVKKELRTLGSVLRYCRRKGEFPFDPEEVIPEFDGQEFARTRVLTVQELEKLCAQLPAERAVVIRLFVATGARHSEAFRVAPEHVEKSRKGRSLNIQGSKTAGATRTVPIVRKWQRAAFPKSLDAIARWPNIRRDLGRACKAAGIPHVSPNDLRRTFATWMLRDGVPPWAVAKLMGHTSMRMLERHYLQPSKDDVLKAVRGAK